MGFNEDITQKYVLNNIDKIKEELNKKLRTDLEFINSIPMHQYTEEDMVKNGDTWADNTIIGEMIKQFHNEKYFPDNTGLNIIIFNANFFQKEKKDIKNIFSCFKGINNILDLNVLIYYNGLDHYQLVKYNDKAILTREELNDIPKFMEIYNKYCIETPKSKPKLSKSKKPKSKKPKSKKSRKNN